MTLISLEQWLALVDDPAGVTIGNFDGVHAGHRALLEEFKNHCSDNGLKPWVFTFRPHPELYFHSQKAHLLTSYERKYQLLGDLGFSVVEIDFGKVRNLTGKEFAAQNLLSKKNLGLLWVGHDFRFGSDKQDPEKCLEGSSVLFKRSKPFIVGSDIVSSTLIRRLLALGKVREANKLLCSNFSVHGRVEKGKQLGRRLGFPTINACIDYPCCQPAFGVYSAYCFVEGERRKAVVNVGRNPTVDKGEKVKWEAHLLNYQGDLYGMKVEISFVDLIREERKFASLEQLTEQIAEDTKAAEASLA